MYREIYILGAIKYYAHDKGFAVLVPDVNSEIESDVRLPKKLFTGRPILPVPGSRVLCTVSASSSARPVAKQILILETPPLTFRGRVKTYNAAKGYGFLTVWNGEDVFCHKSIVTASGLDTLHEGDVLIVTLQTVPPGRLRATGLLRELQESLPIFPATKQADTERQSGDGTIKKLELNPASQVASFSHQAL